MRFLNVLATGNRTNRKNQGFKVILCVFFISLFVLNYFNINENNFKLNKFEEGYSINDDNQFKGTNNNLQASSTSSMLQCPFTENFDLIRNFFETKYASSLT
ncbi:MAG: hypothetical protein ACFFCV_22325, partial [Promethearchaeota archaeon]